MNDGFPGVTTLIMAMAGGGVLGVIFFGGLWWTVHKGIQSSHVGTWFFTSTVLRFGLAIFGFYLITYGQWPRLVACLVGFIIARFLVTKLTQGKPTQEKSSQTDVEDSGADHAP